MDIFQSAFIFVKDLQFHFLLVTFRPFFKFKVIYLLWCSIAHHSLRFISILCLILLSSHHLARKLHKRSSTAWVNNLVRIKEYHHYHHEYILAIALFFSLSSSFFCNKLHKKIHFNEAQHKREMRCRWKWLTCASESQNEFFFCVCRCEQFF